MILPDTLRPLPVSPSGDDREVPAYLFEDFVADGDVRKVILGATELPLEGLPANDFDCFAGRADIDLGARSRVRPAPPQAEAAGPLEIPVPDMAVDIPVLHPAFELLPPARRAAPPVMRPVADIEANYGKSRVSNERWWVLGMGIAACAVLFSGTLVDIISREAVRRSRVEAIVRPAAAKNTPAANAAAAAKQQAEAKSPDHLAAARSDEEE